MTHFSLSLSFSVSSPLLAPIQKHSMEAHLPPFRLSSSCFDIPFVFIEEDDDSTRVRVDDVDCSLVLNSDCYIIEGVHSWEVCVCE
jgi:hypothetical protein